MHRITQPNNLFFSFGFVFFVKRRDMFDMRRKSEAKKEADTIQLHLHGLLRYGSTIFVYLERGSFF